MYRAKSGSDVGTLQFAENARKGPSRSLMNRLSSHRIVSGSHPRRDQSRKRSGGELELRLKRGPGPIRPHSRVSTSTSRTRTWRAAQPVPARDQVVPVDPALHRLGDHLDPALLGAGQAIRISRHSASPDSSSDPVMMFRFCTAAPVRCPSTAPSPAGACAEIEPVRADVPERFRGARRPAPRSAR